ncbi:MAG: glycosyltransferase family 2 protein [Deltaproteobacteria bacterium]|nr:glycosyltransferase family 2 protein [Deltaproteobacteria bacterium]
MSPSKPAEPTEASPRPLVSIVMPVRNEEAYIERSLGSVLAQTYPLERMEIWIADGGSTDKTRELATALGKGAPVFLIDNPRGIVSTGLNAMLEKYQGDILLRVDGHCEIAPDYVERCVHYLQTRQIAGVGGPIETVGEDFLSQSIAVAMSSRFGVGDSTFRTGGSEPTLADTIAFPAYHRSVLEQAGPFDEELVRNQDDEFNYRLRKAGHSLLLAPDLSSRYYSRASLRSLWSQYRQYGFWKVRVLQKHPRQMRWRQFVPPVFVLALLLSLALALTPTPLRPAGRWLAAGVGGSYLVANGVASVWTAQKAGWRYLGVLPAAFALLHLGYGSGFLVGLVRFARRWKKP